MTITDNHLNRYGESKVKAGLGHTCSPLIYEDEYGMRRAEEFDEIDWSHDPRSESAKERHYKRVTQNGFTDESIKNQVEMALYLSPEVDASKIKVKVFQGCVILTGSVKNRKQKKAAEFCIDSIKGIVDIFNSVDLKA